MARPKYAGDWRKSRTRAIAREREIRQGPKKGLLLERTTNQQRKGDFKSSSLPHTQNKGFSRQKQKGRRHLVTRTMEGQFSRMASELLLYYSLLFSLLLVFLSTPINAQHLSAAKPCLDIEPITDRLIVTSDFAPGDERSASLLTFFVEEESRVHQITVSSSGNLLSPAQPFSCERGRANSYNYHAEQWPSIDFQFCRLTVKRPPSAASPSTTRQVRPQLGPVAIPSSDFPLTSLRGCFWRSTPATRFDRRPDTNTTAARSTRTRAV
jgi:hypothetical protein